MPARDLIVRAPRLCTNEAQQYWWHSVGQLISVVTPASDSVAYGYNGLGMRVRRTQGDITTRYLYDGDDLVAEVDSAGNRIRTYRYWPGIDQPHSMQSWESGQNGTVYYYVLDLPSNTVKGLVTSAGTVTHRYSYGSFGEPQGTSGTVGNPLRFAARELDATTGLYYFRARWYDPSMGRFLSEDPIGLAGGINNYAYALNDPVNLGDPLGLGPCDLEWGGWGTPVIYTSTLEAGKCEPQWQDALNQWENDPHGHGRGRGLREWLQSDNAKDWLSCGGGLLSTAVSTAGDLAFLSGAGIALKGGRALWAGHQGARRLATPAMKGAKKKAGNLRRAVRRNNSAGPMTVHGAAEAGFAWVGDGTINAGIHQAMVSNEVQGGPGWLALVPVVGTAVGAYEAGKNCGRAIGGLFQ